MLCAKCRTRPGLYARSFRGRSRLRIRKMEDVTPATGMDYLRVVAVSRIFLDNVVYIQAGWLTEGLKIAQVALAMGANDMGGVLTEEVVVKSTGIETRSSKEQFVDIIKNAGKVPVERDSAYEVIKCY